MTFTRQPTHSWTPLLLIICTAKASTPEDSKNPTAPLSVSFGRTTPPGLKWPDKCWWAKEISPDLHISGRPTERQLKYAADCGFKTVISLYVYPEGEGADGGKSFGGDRLPSTEEEQHVVEEVAGMKFIAVLEPGADKEAWANSGVVRKLTEILTTVDKPVLLHCHNGDAVTFVTLMYLANQTRQDTDFKPRITSNDFYNISSAMGLDFLDPMLQEIVERITGEPIPENPPRPDTLPQAWEEYWVAYPVYKNWFTAGQITRSHIKVMEGVGFRSVINLRSGIMLDGKPNQEEVNLLNVMSNTGTYAGPKQNPRQWKARLEETRIDPYKPNYFISPNSPVNYETQNAEEFGDAVGYQEMDERMAFRGSSLQYQHIPVDVNGPYGTFFERELLRILDIGGEHSPVLIHCKRSKRAAYVAVLAAAVQYDKDLDWALRRTRELGFEVSDSGTPELYQAYVHWLITKRIRDEL